MNSYRSNITSAFLAFLVTIFYCGVVIAGEAPIPADDQISTGPLILPEEDEPGVEKKCLTVCEKWGEACTINPRTGNRRCRRVCKQLGKECF